MNVADYLLAGRCPDAPALIPLGESCSYGELSRAVDSVGAWLAATGLGKGRRVLLVAANSVFWVGSYLAALRAGLIVVPLPATSSMADLLYVIEAAEPACALVEPKVLARNGHALRALPVLTGIPQAPAPPPPATPSGGDDLAALMFTSGSTGKPRGVMVSHRNIIANTESIITALGLASRDRMMAVLPFHYCFGTSLLHTHLRVGGTLVLENRFLFPDVVLQRLRDTECTGFAGVPSHYQILLRRSNIRQMNLPRLRSLQQAGGHLAPAFVRELRQALPQARLWVMYGQTEATARLSYVPPDQLDRKTGSIGIAIPGVTLRLANEAGETTAPGELGEIVAEGENIASGYWRDEAETSKSFRNGRLHTGDLARMDEEGFFYVVDRARDFLKCGGKRVSCREIEETLLECEDLVEAAVIGMADPILGEAVKAFIVPRDLEQAGDIAARLPAFCRPRLPAACVPKQIVVLRALPKNSSGKPSKAALRALPAGDSYPDYAQQRDPGRARDSEPTYEMPAHAQAPPGRLNPLSQA